MKKAAISMELPADRGRCSAQSLGNSANRIADCQGSGYFFALGHCQSLAGPSSLWWTDSTCLRKNVLDRGMRSIEEQSDLMERLALLPFLPHHRFLGGGVVDPWSLLHTNLLAQRALLVCCIDRLNPPSSVAASQFKNQAASCCTLYFDDADEAAWLAI